MAVRPLTHLVVSVALFGCGKDFPRSGVDAGTEDAGPGFEPDPPAAPGFVPCPDGWREVADPGSPGLVTCDPWPESGPEDCTAPDEAHFPGEPGCRRVGTACPAGDWAEDIPGGSTVLYVRAGAAGGDGSLALPFGSVGAAVAAAPDDAVIAISKGTFNE